METQALAQQPGVEAHVLHISLHALDMLGAANSSGLVGLKDRIFKDFLLKVHPEVTGEKGLTDKAAQSIYSCPASQPDGPLAAGGVT